MLQPFVSKIRGLLGRFRGGVLFASGILAALLAVLLYQYLFPADPLTEREMRTIVENITGSATPPPSFSNNAYKVILPSVVLIRADFGTDDSAESSLGSGVIFNDLGNILTCLHVVEGATHIQVNFADGTKANAVIIEVQPEKDIAKLYVDLLPKSFVPAILGNPDALEVGDEVFVVGSPFGLYGSMSAGVVSGFNRSFKPESKGVNISGLIQFDAAANPGNSGGPLLNRDGQVVGIVTGLINPTEANFFVGIGFAVPIGDALGDGVSLPY